MNNDDHTTKVCTKCKTEYPRTKEFFPSGKGRKDGIKSWCRVCCRAYCRQHYNTAPAREARRTYNARPDVMAKARDRSRRLRSDPKIRERSAKYKQKYAADPTKRAQIRKRQHDYKVANPNVYRAADHRRKARVRGLPNTFSARDLQRALAYFGGRCAVCGRELEASGVYSMDHWIPLSAPGCPGTVPHNMIPLCQGENGCNNSKSNRDAKEWLSTKFGKREARRILLRIRIYFIQVRRSQKKACS